MQLRQGREFYGKRYDEAMALHAQGKTASEIALALKISYSTAYHWTRELRKPEAGNVNEFITVLKTGGPAAAVHVLEKFPKHNELFLIASRRGIPIKRRVLARRYRELATWYYLEGQEPELNRRIAAVEEKVAALRKALKQRVEKGSI